jgi:imidazolonepropionase-like amidohydrolase
MSRRAILVSLCSLAAAVSGTASDVIPAPRQEKPIALRGATIHPVSGADIASGVIVFENGRITAVGADAAIPAGADVIDVAGKHIYPGLISANSVSD